MHQPEAMPADSLTDVLYQRHAASILTYVRQRMTNREDAEDIVVETFLSAIEDRKFRLLGEKEQTA
jgi:RNA polymerase sigma-70 factor, ECF subfamily